MLTQFQSLWSPIAHFLTTMHAARQDSQVSHSEDDDDDDEDNNKKLSCQWENSRSYITVITMLCHQRAIFGICINVNKMVMWSTKNDIINKQNSEILGDGGQRRVLRDRVGVWVESCRAVCLGATSYSLVQTLLLQDVWFSHSAQHHRQTDRQHYHANSRSYCMQQYDRLKTIITLLVFL